MSGTDQSLQSEQYEVLDDAGHKTGQLLDRASVHQQQLWHEVANVWIINSQGEVLLQLRGPGVDLNPNVWDVAVGTHVRPNEDPTIAAQRCLQTELGVTIAPDNIKHLFNLQSSNPLPDGTFHKVLGHVFIVKRDINLQDFTYDTNKIAQLEWKPLVDVMAEVGSSEAGSRYHPRPGNYYPKLFEALQAEL